MQKLELNYNIIKNIASVLFILCLVACVNNNAEKLVEKTPLTLNKDTSNSVLYHDFNFFKLRGEKKYKTNDSLPLVKITYDNDGKILFTEILLLNKKPGYRVTYKYDSNMVIGHVVKPAEWESNEIFIFMDSVVIVVVSSLSYLRDTKVRVLDVSEISILNKDLTQSDYYFKPLDVIIKNETDFKYEYLEKAFRIDHKIFTVTKNILRVSTKSNYPANNKQLTYYCTRPFSFYWWYLYGDLMYPNVSNH